MSIKVNSEHFDKPIKANLVIFIFLIIIYIISYFQFSVKQELTGDQPHYLLVTHSIINDFDLDLKNNYLNKDFKSFFPHEAIDPHISRNSVRGRWYSIHNIGLSVLVIPFYYIGEMIHKEQFMVILLMSFLMAGTAVNLYSVCRRLLGEDKIIVIPILASFLSLPLIGYSMQVYPEVPAIFILSYLMKVYLDSKVGIIKSILIGISMGFLGWLHVKFLALAIPLLILFYFSKDVYKSDKMRYIPLLIFVFVVAGMSLSFYYLYGSLSFSSQYASVLISIKHLPQRVLRNFLDQHDGLFFYAPFYVFSIAGIIFLFRKGALNENARKLLVMMMATFAGFIFMTSLIQIEAGCSIPPRFLIPILPLLIIVVSSFIKFTKKGLSKTLFIALLIYSTVLALFTLWFYPGVLYKNFFDFESGSTLLFSISSQRFDFRQVLPNLNSVLQPYTNLALGSVMCLFILSLNLSMVLHGKTKKVFVQLIIISVFFYLGVAVYNTHLIRLVNSNKIINYKASDFRTNCGEKKGKIIFSDYSMTDCFVVFGPYRRIFEGDYIATFLLNLKGDNYSDSGIIKLDVAADNGKTVYAEKILTDETIKNLLNRGLVRIPLSFTHTSSMNAIEFRVFISGKPYKGKLYFKGVDLISN